jgi:hypothetical protein
MVRYIWKVIVYDKILGLGIADAITDDVGTRNRKSFGTIPKQKPGAPRRRKARPGRRAYVNWGRE